MSKDLQLLIRINADGKGARAEIVGAANDLGKLEGAGNRARAGLGNAGRGADAARRNMEKAAGAAGVLVTSLIGLSAASIIRGFVQSADAIKGIEARIRLVSGTLEEYQRGIQGVTEISYRYNQSLDDTAKLYSRIAPVAQDLGRSQADLLKIISGVGAAMRVSNASAAEQSSTVTQLTQTLASATAQWEDFGQLQDTAPALVRAVEKSMSGLVAQHGSLKAAMAAGAVTQAEFFATLVKIAPEFERQAATIDGPVSGGWTNLGTALSEASSRMDKILGVTNGLAGALNALAGSVKNAADRWNAVLPSSDTADRVAAFRAKIIELNHEFDDERGSWFPDQEKLIRLEREIAGMEAAYVSLKRSAEQAANAGTEAFTKQAGAVGNAGQHIQDMSREQLAIIAQVAAEAKRQGADVIRALAVIEQESSFRQSARAETKYGPAVGVGQIIPPTAKTLNIDPTQLDENIRGVVDLMRRNEDALVNALGERGHNVELIVAAYHTGVKNVIDSVKKAGSIPNFQDALGKGTQDYTADVLAKIKKFGSEYAAAEDKIGDALKVQTAEAQRQYDARVKSAELAGDAQKTIANSVLAVDAATLQERAEAYSRYSNAAAGDLSGEQKIAFLRQSAEVEKGLIQQSTDLKLRAIDNERQAAQVSLAAITQQIAARQQLGLTDIQVLQLQDQQRQKETDLASMAQQANAVRIAGAGQIVQAMQQVNDAQRDEEQNIAAAAAARDEYIGKLDAQLRALQAGNEALAEEVNLHRLSAGMASEEARAWEEAANAKLKQIEEVKKAQEEQKKAEKAVADEQLRVANYFEAIVSQAQEAARGMAEAFGKSGAAIGQVVVGLAQAQKVSNQIQQQLGRDILAAGSDEEKQKAAYAKAATQELTSQINTFGNLTQAAQSFFKEGTSGYGALQRATQVYRTVELALALAGYAQMAAASLTFTGTEVVQSAVRGQAAAAEGVANQAKGDPYTAWARMAAMAATMAAIGFAVAFNGGGGSGAVERGARRAQNKGTVLGDTSAESKSIANSLKILQDNSSTDLDYSAQMTRSLKNIEYAMAGVARSVLVNVSAVSGLAGQRPKAQGMGIIPGFKDPIIGDFLFKSTAKIKDWGIGAWPQQLSEILKSGSLQLKTWTDVEFKTSLLGLVTVSKKTKTYLAEASTEMEREFGRVIISLVDSLREGAKAFGMGGDEFARQLQDFQIQWDVQSLKGLKGDELADAISAQFSAIADKMAAALNIQTLDEFQQIGEGIFETLIRVSGGINQARAELEALNIRMIDYRDLTYKQGDVAGELARESIIAFEGAGSAIGKFMADAVGSIENILETYRDLRAITDAMNALGLEAGNLTRSMTEAVGGVSALRDAMDAFQGNFYNEGEQLGVMLESLARQFGALGYAIPDSKEAFRALVESIDTSTEAGQKLFARLIALSEAFAQAADGAKALEDLLASYTDPLAKFKEPIQKVIDDFQAILDGSLAQIKAKFQTEAALQKKEFDAPYLSAIGGKKDYIAIRQAELMSNLRDLEITNARIGELQDLIARWSGAKGAAGYVAAWQSELEAMQAQAEALRGSITGKTAEIDRITKEIEALQKEMAEGDKNIDQQALADSLAALRKKKREILKAEGDALLQTLRDVWDQMIRGIREAQRSIRRQIAELQGPGALRSFTLRQAKNAFSAAMNYQGRDPEEALRRIQNAQSAIMEAYAQQLERISRQIQRQTRQIENQYARLIRHEQKLLQQRIDAINAAADAALKALQKQTDAQIEALNKQQDAELKALDKKYEAEQKGLQEQLDAAKQMQEAIKGVQDYLKNLKLGQFSNLSPEDKLREAQRQFNELLLKAQAGDAQAAGKLTGASDAYLQAAQAYYASSPQYGQILQQVQDALGLVGGMKTTDPDSVQAKIDQLREQQQLDADKIREKYQQQIDAVRESADQMADAIREAADKQIEKAEKRAQRIINKLERERDKLIRDLSDPDKNEALKALREKAIKALKALQDKLEEEEKKAREKMKELIAEVRDLGVLNAAQLRQLQRMAEKMGATIEPVPKYAAGGITRGGYAWVGERGPEPVFFGGPARVVSHEDAMSALRPDQSDKEIRLMREELRREFRALVITQSEANPRMAGALERIEERLSTIERRQRLAA